MAKQSLAVTSTTKTHGAAAAELIAGPVANVRLSEVDIFVLAATQSSFAIGFPAAVGVTPTTPVTLQLHDARDQAATASVAIAWGTPPTVPANFLYIIDIPATAGGGVSISFPEGIVVPVNGTLVVWNIGVGGADNSLADITFTVSTTQAAQTLAIR